MMKALRPPAARRAVARLKSTMMKKETFDDYWMPFTANRHFKKNPKMFESAEGMNYFLQDGSAVMDGCSGLWCVNAGHGHPKIREAIKNQADKLDFAPSFNYGHSLPFEFSRKILDMLPNRGMGQVFFTMCGSTAVDTALKIALAYHKSQGNASKVKFIGRERGYHGVGFGGISVGGIHSNRKAFAANMLPHVDHLPHTHSYEHAFTRGQPEWGAHLADDLERIVALHDASTVAAVIVEPVAGSTGVLPPPKGYLEKLRKICSKHNILLIFDEVITGFGRLGKGFAAEYFDVSPDMITMAKGMTNAAVPAGAVMLNEKIYRDMMSAADLDGPGHNNAIELFHGYTYSGHPLAMAAGLATLEVYQEEGLFERAAELSPYFEAAVHSLKGLPNIVDIRNCGMAAAVEFSVVQGEPMKRTMDIMDRCFENGLCVRVAGPNIALCPPLIAERRHVDFIVDTVKTAVLESAQAF
jgi:beta-alanine--pyruvate transaminase